MVSIKKVVIIVLILLVSFCTVAGCAKSEKYYSVQCESDFDELGSVKCDNVKDKYSFGEIISYTAICSDKSSFKGWYENGALISENEVLNYEVLHNSDIIAKFELKNNVFVFDSKFDGRNLKSELKILGRIKIAGVSVKISCPKPITVFDFSYDKELADAKYKDCELSFVWTKGENATKEFSLLTVEFAPVTTLSIKSVRPFVEVTAVYYINADEKILTSEYSLIVK